MPVDDRIQTLARAILAQTLRADDVPPYDRAAVQECLLVWWLEARPARRAVDVKAIVREPVLPPAKPV